ncbi:EF-hand domain-containing protein [Streptomyces cinerochromogenes]|uniref:EF-hand domain-containing protein n=1 Tax=Streptomyces cinerochromogenes TaxID=66422 RepID=UPI0033AEA102
MVTKTERDHFQRLFRQLDADGDGVIAQVDVDQLVHGAVARSGAAPGSPEWRRVVDLGNRIWYGLRDTTDADKDGTVSAREFVTAYRRPEFLEQTVVPFELAVLEMADRDGDGSIALHEWAAWQAAKGMSPVEMLSEFTRLDADGDGCLSKEECAQHIRAQYTA